MQAPREIGRYALFAELAAGGMATVHIARLRGSVGFARTVAIKRLHPNFAKDPDFVSMFLDEARLAARIRHPNVVSVLDVESVEGELFLVMEYVQGESLSKLMKSWAQPLPSPRAARIAADMLYGLHAAHEAKNERGMPLHIVHRDISPQNVLVGQDGVSRVADFGVAKASDRIQTTHEGQLKGKLCYMAPEQLEEKMVDRRTDIYAASVVLWEMLTGRRLHPNQDPGATVTRILTGKVPLPSEVVPDVPPEIDRIVARGLAKRVEDRFATGEEMAVALEHATRLESQAKLGAWVSGVAVESLAERAKLVAELEASDSDSGTRASGTAIAVQLARTAMESLSGEPATAQITPSRPGASPEPISAPQTGDPRSKSNVNVGLSLRPSGRRPLPALVVVAAASVVLLVVVSVIGLIVSSRRPSSAAASPVTSSAPLPPPPPSASVASVPATSEAPPPSASAEAPTPEPSAKPASKKTAKGWKPPSATTKPPSAFGNLTRE